METSESVSTEFTAAFDESDARLVTAYRAVALRVYAEEHVPFPWEG